MAVYGEWTQLRLNAADRRALQRVQERYGQQTKSAALRLCINLVAHLDTLALDFREHAAHTGDDVMQG